MMPTCWRAKGDWGRVLALSILIAPLLTGCATDTSSWLAGETAAASVADIGGKAPPLVGRALWSGETSRAQAQAFLVARTPAEWAALWDLVGRPPPGDLPNELMALGIFLGTRTTTGYSVDILRVRSERQVAQRDRLVVEFREKSPPEGQMTTQVLTSPYAVIMVDRSEAGVRYNKLP
ncbi:protease complex subunit PrcB family protein [Niveispirillum sp. SYP-B3756]|uniref:protease complex subunit PrcB family protein n=1 Tax=Niveispirillum sp. SYP-B3756 TaxID=2662178 RepID=UPI001FFF5FC7|nr:protease complex subunit PrcB family protein [Niveispirillum sp. SYP-B3756]